MLTLVLTVASLAQTPPAGAKAPAPPAAAVAGPVLAPCSVLAPTFTIAGKPVAAGTMFATAVGDKTVLVTAYSLFGPSAGLPAQLTPEALAKDVTGVVAKDAKNPRTECARATKNLTVADAAAFGGKVDGAKDVAVFLHTPAAGLDRLQAVEPVPLARLPFAAKAPKVGDSVWLASRINGKEELTFPGKAVEVNAGFLFFEYVDKDLDLAGSIGAPILDASGSVVGINLGGGKMADGALIGSATPLASIKQRVDAAAASK